MSMITLGTSAGQEYTLLSNTFIDTYMPRANGEFVKVYIYLLRLISVNPSSFSLENMADCLFCTEKDILRALKYWEKEQLVLLTFNDKNEIAGIMLQSPSGGPQPARTEAVASAAKLSKKPEVKPPSAGNATLTPDRVKELKKNDDVIQLLYIAEQYMGKTLTPTEMQKLLFFYDELHMSADLIDFLIEHCVGRGHKSIRYMETVALAWAEEGITTVEMAKNTISRYGKEYYMILKAMGITNRNPVDTETALMDTWMNEYGFSMELIQEACSRTVMQTGQPSFQYADKILSGWKKKKVRHLDDVRVLDAEYKKRKLEKAVSSRSAQQPAPKTPNRFNNFHQREYDFDEYEKRLLNQ